MGDLKVVGAVVFRDRLLVLYSDGAIEYRKLGRDRDGDEWWSNASSEDLHELDPDGHVWAAITGSQVSREDKITEAAAALASLRLRGPQERPASTVSPDSPELAALRDPPWKELLREIRDLVTYVNESDTGVIIQIRRLIAEFDNT